MLFISWGKKPGRSRVKRIGRTRTDRRVFYTVYGVPETLAARVRGLTSAQAGKLIAEFKKTPKGGLLSEKANAATAEVDALQQRLAKKQATQSEIVAFGKPVFVAMLEARLAANTGFKHFLKGKKGVYRTMLEFVESENRKMLMELEKLKHIS